MPTIVRAAAFLAIPFLLLAACGSKKQIPFDPGQMHELNLPRQASAPEPAAAQPPVAQPSAAGQSPSAAQPSQAAQPKPGELPPASLGAADSAITVWPLILSSENVTFQVHEPTLESWQDGVLIARCLVLAQPPGNQPPVNGLAVIKGITQVDAAAGIVSLQDLKVKGTEFSAPADKTQAWQEFLRFSLADKIKTVSLASLQSGQDVVKTRQQASAAADIAAPIIIFSETPAVLVYIDGDPRYVPVKGTKLTGVLNTRVLLLKDASGIFYLRVYDGWVSSKSLQGPWKIASPPPGADKLEQKAIATRPRQSPSWQTGRSRARSRSLERPAQDHRGNSADGAHRAGRQTAPGRYSRHHVGVCEQYLRTSVQGCIERTVRADPRQLVPRQRVDGALAVCASREPRAAALRYSRRSPEEHR